MKAAMVVSTLITIMIVMTPVDSQTCPPGQFKNSMTNAFDSGSSDIFPFLDQGNVTFITSGCHSGEGCISTANAAPVSAFVDTSYINSLEQVFSISFWIKRVTEPSSDNSDKIIFMKLVTSDWVNKTSESQYMHLEIARSDPTRVALWCEGMDTVYVPNALPVDQNFHHWVLTWNRGYLSIFIDGLYSLGKQYGLKQDGSMRIFVANLSAIYDDFSFYPSELSGEKIHYLHTNWEASCSDCKPDFYCSYNFTGFQIPCASAVLLSQANLSQFSGCENVLSNNAIQSSRLRNCPRGEFRNFMVCDFDVDSDKNIILRFAGHVGEDIVYIKNSSTCRKGRGGCISSSQARSMPVSVDSLYINNNEQVFTISLWVKSAYDAHFNKDPVVIMQFQASGDEGAQYLNVQIPQEEYIAYVEWSEGRNPVGYSKSVRFGDDASYADVVDVLPDAHSYRHWVFSWNFSHLMFYVDGTLRLDSQYAFSKNTSVLVSMLGLPAIYDDISFHPYALSSQEVVSLHNNGTPRCSACQAKYHCDVADRLTSFQYPCASAWHAAGGRCGLPPSTTAAAAKHTRVVFFESLVPETQPLNAETLAAYGRVFALALDIPVGEVTVTPGITVISRRLLRATAAHHSPMVTTAQASSSSQATSMANQAQSGAFQQQVSTASQNAGLQSPTVIPDSVGVANINDGNIQTTAPMYKSLSVKPLLSVPSILLLSASVTMMHALR